MEFVFAGKWGRCDEGQFPQVDWDTRSRRPEESNSSGRAIGPGSTSGRPSGSGDPVDPHVSLAEGGVWGA